MALNQQQINTVIQTLTAASLDPAIVLEVGAILNLQYNPPSQTPVQTSTPYEDIKEFCAAFGANLQVIGRGVAQMDADDEMMLVYMEKASVSNILSKVPTGGYVAAVMGVYENSSLQSQLTVSLLATDSNFDFVKDTNGDPVNGEQCWKNFNTVQNFSTVFP